MNVLPSNVIHRPFQRTYATAVAFLSIQQEDLQKNLLQLPVGFAVCRLIGNYFQTIEVAEIISFPLERERVINWILNWSQTNFRFDYCYVDKDNYIKFNSDRKWDLIIKARNNNNIKYPRLKVTVRSDDLIYRQKEALSQPFADKTFKVAASLNNPADLASLDQVGSSPALDALAGAMVEIQKIQKTILSSVAKEQQRMKAANGRSLW